MVLKPQVIGYFAGKVENKFNLRNPMGKKLALMDMLKTGRIIRCPKWYRNFWHMRLIVLTKTVCFNGPHQTVISVINTSNIRLKKKKHWWTVSLCCCINVSGSDKRKLLVTAKSAKPHYFKWLRMVSCIPVHYFNKTAWTTSTIFQEWVVTWDVELQKKSRKILLIIDNCAQIAKKITIEILPLNTESVFKPLDMCIIKKN